MERKVCVLLFVALALIASCNADSKFYKDYISVNSRVPGDQLLLQSKNFSQNLDFFATVTIELRYPQDQSTSKYSFTHLLVTGQDDTGYIDYKSESGDSIRCKIILNSVQHGYYQAFLYGKKI